MLNVAASGAIGGALAGATIAFPSIRESMVFSFRLLQLMYACQRLSLSRYTTLCLHSTLSLSHHVQVRRQLEYTIAEANGIHLVKPPGTMEVVKDIYKSKGIPGLYTGGRLHFSALVYCPSNNLYS